MCSVVDGDGNMKRGGLASFLKSYNIHDYYFLFVQYSVYREATPNSSEMAHICQQLDTKSYIVILFLAHLGLSCKINSTSRVKTLSSVWFKPNACIL